MKKFVDDGRTIYSMDNVGSPEKLKRNAVRSDSESAEKEKVTLRRKERLAAIAAGFEVYLPIFLMVIACFAVVAVLMYLWLK